MNCIIYKLSSKNTDEVYIGSTKNLLSTRLCIHEDDYYRERSKCGSGVHISAGEYCVEILEEIVYENDKQKRIREQFWMDKFPRLSNIRRAYLHDSLKKQRKKVSDKKYRESHKEQLKLKHCLYYKENKEELSAKAKIYRDNNPELMKQQSKDYREKNYDEIKIKKAERKTCPQCGNMVSNSNMGRHKKKYCKNKIK